MDITLPRAIRPVADTTTGIGARVSIRSIDRADAASLSELYHSLSPEARHARFLGACGDVALDGNVERLAGAPGFVAVLNAPGPSDGTLVGHVVMLPGSSGSVEVALVVVDGQRGRGIGTALMRAAVGWARRLGFERLTATTYADNLPMRRLLDHVGARKAQWTVDCGVAEGSAFID